MNNAFPQQALRSITVADEPQIKFIHSGLDIRCRKILAVVKKKGREKKFKNAENKHPGYKMK